LNALVTGKKESRISARHSAVMEENLQRKSLELN
jgi:hypothetical protein